MEEQYGYIRQSEHCYLRREKERENSFEVTMLLQNPMPGLLPCRQQQMNEKNYLLYDVTSRKVLADWWAGKSLQEEELRRFVQEIIHILRECDRNMLDREKVVLQPELIFCDMDARQYYFLYDPLGTPAPNENLMQMAQFLVEKADYTSQPTVDLAYRIFEAVSGANFTIRTLEQCLEHWEERQDFSEKRLETDTVPVQKDEETLLDREEWEEPKESRKTGGAFMQKAALAVSGGTLLLGAWVFTHYELTRKELVLLIGILLLAVATAVCAVVSWVRKNGERDAGEEMDSEDTDVMVYPHSQKETESEKTLYLAQGELLNQRGLQGMGKEWQRWISLGSLPFVIGKKEGFADYILEDDTISRMHARFVREDDHIFIVDLHSTNGTYVNGVRLEPDNKVELQAGDQIAMGKLNFTYC